MKKTTLKLGKAILAFALAVMVGVTFMPITADSVYGASFKTKGTVKNVKVSAYTYNSITMTWDKYKKATGYIIYKSSGKNKPYTRLKETTKNKFKRTGLTTNLTCYYRICAYHQDSSGARKYSKYCSAVAATPKLDKPKVTLSAGESKLTLTWKAVSGASGYKVFRSTSKNKGYSCIKTLTGKKLTEKSLKENKTYYYKVRAYRTIDGKKKKGPFSKVKSGSIGTLAKVKGVTAKSVSSGIKLTWKSVDSATGYQIYRAQSSPSNYSKVGSTKNLNYTDKNVTKNITYYYKVRAYRTVGDSTTHGAFSKKGYSRAAVVKQAVKWLGCKESDGSHKKIIDVYNSNPGSGNGKLGYYDAWCAVFVSAVAIKTDSTKIIVRGTYCPTVRSKYVNSSTSKYSYGKGSSYKPSAGDVIFFDWNRNGVPDHTGLVATVSGKTIKTIEGNYSDSVKYRTFSVGYSYVLGYGLPNYNDANGIVYTGKSSSSVGCGELTEEGIETSPEGYDDLGGEFTTASKKISDDISEDSDLKELKKMKKIVKTVRKNADTDGIDCTKSQYYAAFVYKLCKKAGIDASIVSDEVDSNSGKTVVEASLDGKWYRVDATKSKKKDRIKSFKVPVTDTNK